MLDCHAMKLKIADSLGGDDSGGIREEPNMENSPA